MCHNMFGRLWNPKHPTMKAKQDLKDKHRDKEIVNSILVPFSQTVQTIIFIGKFINTAHLKYFVVHLIPLK